MNTDPANHAVSATVAEVERDVAARSAVFKKELGLFDLVLTQVVFMVGTIWVGFVGAVTVTLGLLNLRPAGGFSTAGQFWWRLLCRHLPGSVCDQDHRYCAVG